jgi:wobble nucleotide-excising tRNase
VLERVQVISFLYFLELCKGRGTDQNGEIVTDKIVVIDDPISSLSHMYIFNVAEFIRKNFFNEGYKQIFILTHNLYFFHELVNIAPKLKDDRFKLDGNLFRISKKVGNSQINVLKQSEIQNDYQSYWQILKDCTVVNSNFQVLLPNTMRNILEYFFGFIDGQSLNNVVQKIDKEQKYQFFIRYMHRESHSEAVNISDLKDIDIEIFKEAFKKIFEVSGHIEHYNKMMN